MILRLCCLFWLGLILNYIQRGVGLGEVIYAINAGGEAHIDSDGIHYKRDPLHGKIGTASDYGKQLIIGRTHRSDQILYQTERYHHGTFGYDVPVNKDGEYVLVLKFCEVYFNSPGMKVFDVVLNGVHTVVSDLDIYVKVGKGVAHDEYIPFRVKGNKIIVNGEQSEHDGKIKVEFIKGYRDNPKVNAVYVMRGALSEVPQLPSLSKWDTKEEEEDDLPVESKTSQVRRPSGPRSPNPYTTEDSSTLLPIFVAIGAFIPLVFCLCKL